MKNVKMDKSKTALPKLSAKVPKALIAPKKFPKEGKQKTASISAVEKKLGNTPF